MDNYKFFPKVEATDMSLSRRKLVSGHGINDSVFNISYRDEDGKQIVYLPYKIWTNMLDRCYSDKFKTKNPTYLECSVSDDWLLYSNFEKWFNKNYIYGFHLDKDLIVSGNKRYCENNCMFISAQANLLFVDRLGSRGLYPIGVSYDKSRGKYIATISYFGKTTHIGRYPTIEESSLAYQIAKRNYVQDFIKQNRYNDTEKTLQAIERRVI